MEKMPRSVATFVIGVAVGSLVMPALSQQVRTLKTTRLVTTDLAGFCDGKEVVVDYSEVAPGASAKHYHPGYSFGYMIEGSQTSTQEGRPPIVVRKGELLLEEPTQANISGKFGAGKSSYVQNIGKGEARDRAGAVAAAVPDK
jgi:hypothetical protein